MNLSMVLLKIIEQLACQLQLVLVLLITTTHQHLQPSQLQLGKVKLIQTYYQDCFPTFEVSQNIRIVIYNFLYDQFILIGTELIFDFLSGSQLVGIMNIDEMRFDIVRNGLVVFRFPKDSLPSSAETIFGCSEKSNHYSNNYN